MEIENNTTFCPLVDNIISIDDCIENVSVVEGSIVESSLPSVYKQKHDWKEICQNCENYDIMTIY